MRSSGLKYKGDKMVKKNILKSNDLIKCFDATGSPFVISFADFKACLKPEKVEKKVEKKKEKKVEKPE